jgi:hypothetical protein
MEAKILKISLPKDVLDTINKDLELLGNTESERIQNIAISSIFQKNYDLNSIKDEFQHIKSHIRVIENVISIILDLHVMDEDKECTKIMSN